MKRLQTSSSYVSKKGRFRSKLDERPANELVLWCLIKLIRNRPCMDTSRGRVHAALIRIPRIHEIRPIQEEGGKHLEVIYFSLFYFLMVSNLIFYVII